MREIEIEIQDFCMNFSWRIHSDFSWNQFNESRFDNSLNYHNFTYCNPNINWPLTKNSSQLVQKSFPSNFLISTSKRAENLYLSILAARKRLIKWYTDEELQKGNIKACKIFWLLFSIHQYVGGSVGVELVFSVYRDNRRMK